ncbi:MAG TPA: recombinase family protein, partial [Syntrophomonas sp.]|nr:recombinase family protein [Syntrophomonas sp.]
EITSMKKIYGFETAPSGLLQITPEQATIVQKIYRQYLSGKSLGGIADFLFEKGISSPSGKEHWGRSVLDVLLSNSKYLNGIVNFDDYFAVQIEKGKRSNIDEDSNKRKATQYYSKDVLSGLLICEECGAVYWRITRPSGEIVWRCSNKVKHGKRVCQHAPSILEDDLKRAICEILDISEFDPQTVKANLECAHVTANGSLVPEFIQREYVEMGL